MDEIVPIIIYNAIDDIDGISDISKQSIEKNVLWSMKNTRKFIATMNANTYINLEKSSFIIRGKYDILHKMITGKININLIANNEIILKISTSNYTIEEIAKLHNKIKGYPISDFYELTKLKNNEYEFTFKFHWFTGSYCYISAGKTFELEVALTEDMSDYSGGTWIMITNLSMYENQLFYGKNTQCIINQENINKKMLSTLSIEYYDIDCNITDKDKAKYYVMKSLPEKNSLFKSCIGK